jgi:hypothetical protein
MLRRQRNQDTNYSQFLHEDGLSLQTNVEELRVPSTHICVKWAHSLTRFKD